jgi:ATP-dependent Clp protease ATP-binding subunit ClpA
LLIQDTIRRALADELLFGRLVDGGLVVVVLDVNGEVVLEFPSSGPDEPGSKASSRPEPVLVD